MQCPDREDCTLSCLRGVHTPMSKTQLQRKKELLGKRTSEGYKPEPGEKVEVRGD
jgi:hypothetical protein